MKAQKRVCLMAAACGLAVSAAHAQVSIVSNVAGSFTDISGGAPVVTGDDQAAGVTVSAAAANTIFPAGTLSVCTNGHAGYGFDTEYGNGPLPNTAFYGGGAAAAVLWDDLITHQPAAGVYAQEVVEGGVTVLVVEWVRMDHYFTSTDNATFELKIYGGGTATSGTGPGGAFAQYIYSHVLFGDPTLDNGASATIGFQYNGTSAEQYSFDTASIQDGAVLSLVHGTTGACCLGNGSCTQLSANNCNSQGGTYHGDNSPCATANCPSGACCLNDGSCVTSASAGCNTLGGVYRGDGTACATTTCPRGACCLADASCVDTGPGGCSTQGGVYRGDGTACATTTCPHGACCLAVGCIITGPGACSNSGGTYHGDNSTCAQAGCPQAWVEQGDAGDVPATAQAVTGSGPLPAILGSLDLDCDMYKIQICDAANFSANMGDDIATTFFDTQLFLFDSTGHGIVMDDDDPQGTLGLHSRLSAQFVPGNGVYYLAVTGYDQDPLGDQTASEIWADTPFNVERRPDGPAAGEMVASWDANGFYSGTYTIALTGTCFISGSTCYANCDGSTAVPFLNIGDFVCFQSAFAAGSSYANCDGSTAPPVLNIGDFVCFQSSFAAGCSAP